MAVQETWSMEGKFHRVDGPAFMNRCPITGIVTHEVWFQHDEIHRESGPAVIKRKADTGRVYYTAWFQNGKNVPAAERPRRPTRKLLRLSKPTR
jgi:hypothetical protein